MNNMNNVKSFLYLLIPFILISCSQYEPSASNSIPTSTQASSETSTPTPPPEINVFDRMYKIDDIDLDFNEKKSSGDCWDAFCGAPDGFVEVYVDNRLIKRTATEQDSFSAAWTFRDALFKVYEGSRIEFKVFDEDISDHDAAFSCSISSINADDLNSGSLFCMEDAGSISSTFSPN